MDLLRVYFFIVLNYLFVLMHFATHEALNQSAKRVAVQFYRSIL